MNQDQRTVWEQYKEAELQALSPILKKLEIELEPIQPHTLGERYLMQAVTTASGRKLILLGHMHGARVVVKATRDVKGAKELEHERTSRELLARIRFAYEVFHSPEEVCFEKRGGFTISVQRYIEQDSPFIERPLKEQFSLALSAFKAQEGTRATTYGHLARIRKSFGVMGVRDYLAAFQGFAEGINKEGGASLSPLLAEAADYLETHGEAIEQYTGFLTHTDFVPHNFRVVGKDIYLLDHSSIRFGNKYEGWARFLNFMALYNPELETSLTEYVRLNRADEELIALSAMRVYRLGEIIWYYTQAVQRSEGDLRTLNQARISFWARMLRAQLSGVRLSEDEIRGYQELRDSLRSEDEKLRQKDLH